MKLNRVIKFIDWFLIMDAFLLMFIGLIQIYSATKGNTFLNHGDSFYFVKKQAIACLIGIVGMFLMLFIDYNLTKTISKILYFGCLFVLVLGCVFKLSKPDKNTG